MCAGGVTYLTNAYIALRLLRHHGCDLPVEIWYQDDSEVDERSKALFSELDVAFHSSRDEALSRNLPPPTGWALKPFAILHSAFDEVLYLDSDNFVVRDPTYLFDCHEFLECGAVFWPDLQKSSPYNRVWEMLGLYPRDEWEFESGQILVKKSEFLEPLRFALQMNYEADRYYQHIWGDKDTFRFAWHKSGRRFAMPDTGVELLTAANGPKNGGVMCQHDFEGRRVFQHRNILKWQLFGNNPHVAGFFHEPLCRKFLEELRVQWDGQLHSDQGQAGRPRKKIAKVLAGKPWLISGVGRVKSHRVTTTDNLYGMRDRGLAFTWDRSSSESGVVDSDGIADGIRKSSEEIRFVEDGRVEGLASMGLWHWEACSGRLGDSIRLHGDRNIEMILRPRRDLPFPCWEGGLGERDSFQPVRMAPFSDLFPVLRKRLEAGSGSHLNGNDSRDRLLLKNTTSGIGDHVHGLYVAVGATKLYREVVLLSRHSDWLARASHPGLTVTAELPADANEYEEVNLGLRYELLNRHAESKLKWYADLVGPACIPARPAHIDFTMGEPITEFSRYVVFAPYAARATRNWAAAHWLRLTHHLEGRGYQVVVLGVGEQESDIAETFGRSNAAWLIDLDPATVCNLLLGAEFAVGLDSGIIHLCGLLGVKAYAIHAQLPPEFLFECAPSITSIFASGECAGCRWQPERGHTSACRDACSEMAGISAGRVIELIDETISMNGIAIDVPLNGIDRPGHVRRSENELLIEA